MGLRVRGSVLFLGFGALAAMFALSPLVTAVHAEAPKKDYPLMTVRGDLVGRIWFARARLEQSLADLSRIYDMGYEEMVQANPGVHRWLPGQDTPIRLPNRFVLPNAPRDGLIVNVAEMRIYHFPAKSGGRQVHTYPISIGRMDWSTPLGETKIMRKDVNPPWYPPPSIRKEYLQDGEVLPAFYPGGSPDNPLGAYALRLTIPGYLIHGVDERKALGIGMRVTHGCIRMYPEDIAHLFPLVSVGQKVTLVDQAVKAGWSDGFLYLEIHKALDDEEHTKPITLDSVFREIQRVGGDPREVNVDQVKTMIEKGDGIPRPVLYRAPRPAPVRAMS